MSTNKNTYDDLNACPVCDAGINDSLRYCPTCSTDVGAPNVRLCRIAENIEALDAKYRLVQSRATAGGYSEAFKNLGDLVKEKSSVVIAMSASLARSLVEDPRFIYANYDKLVDGGLRAPATLNNDRHRCIVGAALFGSYADSIHYGALSLTEHGIPTYGVVQCKLRTITIDKRTTFLETNSYKFISDDHVAAGEKPPVGHTACWENRHKLALSKLAGSLSNGQNEADWQALLIQTDGQNRANDEFIEAHIYDGFDIKAVDTMVQSPGVKLSKAERVDIDLALDAFRKTRGNKE